MSNLPEDALRQDALSASHPPNQMECARLGAVYPREIRRMIIDPVACIKFRIINFVKIIVNVRDDESAKEIFGDLAG